MLEGSLESRIHGSSVCCLLDAMEELLCGLGMTGVHPNVAPYPFPRQEELAALGDFLAAYISGGLASHPLDLGSAAASSLDPSMGTVSDAANTISSNPPPSLE